MLPDFFCSIFPVQQTTGGIGHRVNKVVFRVVGNHYAEFEKQLDYVEDIADGRPLRLAFT